MTNCVAISSYVDRAASPRLAPIERPVRPTWQPRVLIVTPKPIFRAALCWALFRYSNEWDLVEVASIAETKAFLEARRCALIVFDVEAFNADAVSAGARLKAQFAVPIVCLTADAQHADLRQMRMRGILGQVDKSSSLEEIAAALGQLFEQAMRAPTRKKQSQVDDDNMLTPAQRKVLVLMERGQLNKQIAFQLNIAESTVKAHVGAIFRKLKVQNRVQATLAAQRQQAWEWQNA